MALPTRHRALLLVGPTGAGKTPLGELLEERGFGGHRCLHFDFGHHLRRAADGADYGLTTQQVATVRSLLASNALLPDDQFPIAAAILEAQLRQADLASDDWLILNGLPRHVQQARGLEPLVDVRALIVLDCAAAVVLHRITTNAGGDRASRTDDTTAEIARKLDIFQQRTEPLIDHYRARGATIVRIDVAPSTTATELYRRLGDRPSPIGIT